MPQFESWQELSQPERDRETEKKRETERRIHLLWVTNCTKLGYNQCQSYYAMLDQYDTLHHTTVGNLARTESAREIERQRKREK